MKRKPKTQEKKTIGPANSFLVIPNSSLTPEQSGQQDDDDEGDDDEGGSGRGESKESPQLKQGEADLEKDQQQPQETEKQKEPPTTTTEGESSMTQPKTQTVLTEQNPDEKKTNESAELAQTMKSESSEPTKTKTETPPNAEEGTKLRAETKKSPEMEESKQRTETISAKEEKTQMESPTTTQSIAAVEPPKPQQQTVPGAVVCDRCDGIGVVECQECGGVPLCNECSQDLHKIGKFKLHKLSPIDTSQQRNVQLSVLIGSSDTPHPLSVSFSITVAELKGLIIAKFQKELEGTRLDR
jgi:hypothetical protein